MQNSNEELIKEALTDADSIKSIIGSDKVLYEEILSKLKDEERRRFLHYTPYSKQLEFHSSKATERILSGANQSGKSLSGCMEVCFHLTGEYPDWWKGHVIDPRTNAGNGQKEINIWVVGTDSKTVRDSLQNNRS